MFERYTGRARRSVFYARHTAITYKASTIEAEFLLLGVLREEPEIVRSLPAPAMTRELVEAEISRRFQAGPAVPTSADMPLSNACKRALAYAAQESEQLHHLHIGNEHLLLGLLREGRSVAATILAGNGLELARLRELLTTSGTGGAASPPGALPQAAMPPRHPSEFPHAMLREIYEQPEVLGRVLDSYTDGVSLRREILDPAQRILDRLQTGEVLIAASGSSRHAGLVGGDALQQLADIRAGVAYSSEYIGRIALGEPPRCCLLLSQSGETADTLEALRKARDEGAITVAVTNQPGSTMAADADISLPLEAGPEKAVPATKSFTAQLLVLHLLALALAEQRQRMGKEAVRDALERARGLMPRLAVRIPQWEASLRGAMPVLRGVRTFLFLGRGPHFPIASEGALKMKESAYVQAEGYPAGELKHGPNALVSGEVMLVVLATRDRTDAGSELRYAKTLQLLRDLKAQHARVLAVASEDDTNVSALCEYCLFVPAAPELLAPIVEVVPLQLLAYLVAVDKGIDVDRPRNLVKSVTRE